jgi:hypothetical protein
MHASLFVISSEKYLFYRSNFHFGWGNSKRLYCSVTLEQKESKCPYYLDSPTFCWESEIPEVGSHMARIPHSRNYYYYYYIFETGKNTLNQIT